METNRDCSSINSLLFLTLSPLPPQPTQSVRQLRVAYLNVLQCQLSRHTSCTLYLNSPYLFELFLSQLPVVSPEEPSFIFKGKNAAAAKSLQSCLALCDPIGSSPPGSPISGILQAPLSLGFSRQEHWSGLPFPSPMRESESESESEVSQSYPTLSNPMHCSPLGSSIHGIFQARVLE